MASLRRKYFTQCIEMKAFKESALKSQDDKVHDHTPAKKKKQGKRQQK